MSQTQVHPTRTIEAQVRYLASAWSISIEPPRIFDRDTRRSNTEIKTVSIQDARPIRDSLELDEHGFSLYEMKSKVKDFQDPEQVKEIYFPEIIDFVKTTTGASEVFATQHLVRTEDTSDFNKAYARFIHCDYSILTAREFSHARLRAGGKNPSNYESAEFAWYNTWQPFDHNVQKNPLAVIDSSTLGEDDVIPYIYGGYGKEARSSMPVFNPNHRFYYFSQMTPDEVMLVKQLDTRDVKARVTPHTSFELPNMDPEALPRRSIEVRLMCVFTDREHS